MCSRAMASVLSMVHVDIIPGGRIHLFIRGRHVGFDQIDVDPLLLVAMPFGTAEAHLVKVSIITSTQ